MASEWRSTWAPLCADSTPACFRARITSEEIVDEFPKPTNGARWRMNTLRVARTWPVVTQIGGKRLAYIVSQWQLGRLPAFSANGDLARAPIDIVQVQTDNFAGAYAEPGEQQQDRIVPSANGRLSVTALQNPLHRSAGRNLGSVESDQLGTVGTQAARSVAIAPRCRRYRKNDRSAVTISSARTGLN